MMQVVILRVPSVTTKGDVRKLIEELLTKRLQLPFTGRPSVSRCKIISIKAQSGDTETHAIITIEPDKAAQWLIKHFKRRRLHNKMVSARQYFTRHTDSGSFDPATNRRRDGLDITVVDTPKVSVEAMPQFLKEYH